MFIAGRLPLEPPRRRPWIPLSALLGSVWYLVLIAAISPVMILNANAAVHGQKQNHGWAFVSGAGLVLGAIGVTSFGLLGSAATDFASRQLASRTVDRVLGVLLFLFGCYLARTKWVSHHVQKISSQENFWAAVRWCSRHVHLGALGMATNFTTIPLFISSSQRIGTARSATRRQNPDAHYLMVDRPHSGMASSRH